MKAYRRITVILFGCFFMLTGIKVEAAGNINANEAAVISAAQSTYQYNGKNYKVKSSYINQAYAYFSKDGVNLTARQKASILAKASGMVATGIQKGYLVEIESSSSNQTAKKENAKKDEENTTSATGEESTASPSSTDKQDSTGENKANESGTDAKYEEATSVIQIADDKNAKENSTDLLQEATNLAEQLKLGIKVDTATKKIAVTDNDGKVIFDNEKVIKATGFSLLPTAIGLGACVFGFLLCIVIIFKNKLFTYGEDRE